MGSGISFSSSANPLRAACTSRSEAALARAGSCESCSSNCAGTACRHVFGIGRSELADSAALAKTKEALKHLMPVEQLEGVRARRSAMGKL